MLGYLSVDIICSEKRTVFRERNSRETASFAKQIMSKDEYSSIFSIQIKAIAFSILQIVFRNARSFGNWRICSDIPAVFGHVSGVSENI